MGRPRTFDAGVVRETIRDVFWQNGFAGTSMQDLVAATGVKAGSLHAAFGTKDDLFHEAFDDYGIHFVACMDTGERGVDAIRAYMQGLLRAVLDDQKRKGCLIVQAATEYHQHRASTQALVASRLESMRMFFREHLAEDGIDDAELADALFGATVSVLALGRTKIDPAVLQAIVSVVLQRLP